MKFGRGGSHSSFIGHLPPENISIDCATSPGWIAFWILGVDVVK